MGGSVCYVFFCVERDFIILIFISTISSLSTTKARRALKGILCITIRNFLIFLTRFFLQPPAQDKRDSSRTETATKEHKEYEKDIFIHPLSLSFLCSFVAKN